MPGPAKEYLRRAQAIKPNAAYVRYIEFVGVMTQHGVDQALAAAWALIEDDIEDRKGSWYEPMMYVMMVAASNGTLRQTLARLDETYPGFSDLSNMDLSSRLRFVRLDAVGLWIDVYEREELIGYIRREEEWLSSTGVPEPESFELNLLKGNLDAAYEIASNSFLYGSVPLDWPWRMFLQCPSNAELAADPRVLALTQRWEHEEQQIKQQLVTYFSKNPTGP
jgi:hypothetical protein